MDELDFTKDECIHLFRELYNLASELDSESEANEQDIKKLLKSSMKISE